MNNNTSFRQDINKGNFGEIIIKILLQNFGINRFKYVADKHKKYDFILDYKKFKKNIIMLKRYFSANNDYYSLFQDFIESVALYKKMNNEDFNKLYLDVKNNLWTAFDGKRYIFLEVVSNGLLLGKKELLEKHLNINKKEVLDFYVINFSLLDKFIDKYENDRMFKKYIDNNYNKQLIIKFDSFKIFTKFKNKFIKDLAKYYEKYKKEMKLELEGFNPAEEKDLKSLLKLIQEKNFLIYIIYSWGWGLNTETDIYSFIQAKDNNIHIVFVDKFKTMDYLLNFFGTDENKVSFFKEKYRKVKLKFNKITVKEKFDKNGKKWIEIWQSAYLPVNIENLKQGNYGNILDLEKVLQ